MVYHTSTHSLSNTQGVNRKTTLEASTIDQVCPCVQGLGVGTLCNTACGLLETKPSQTYWTMKNSRLFQLQFFHVCKKEQEKKWHLASVFMQMFISVGKEESMLNVSIACINGWSNLLMVSCWYSEQCTARAWVNGLDVAFNDMVSIISKIICVVLMVVHVLSSKVHKI